LVDASSVPADALGGLSAEQRKAAMHILTSRDTVTGIVGKAGTGKTRMMRTTVDAIHAQTDKKVFTFAPSAQASRGVLANEGFKDATTLETLLRDEKLQGRVRGQIIWVDEAGLVSSRDMKRLMDVAKKGGSRVVLSGDYTQHASVEAGDAFRLLEQEAGVRLARLTEVRRQTEPGYKKAVERISQGSGRAAQKGFDALDKMGWVIEASGEERFQLLVGDYLKAMEDGKTGLIIAPTHSEGGRLTDALRATLKEQGALGKDHVFVSRRTTGWTEAQKGDSRNYEAGMIVEFQQNAKGFTKGDKAVVINGSAGLLLQRQDGTQTALPLDQSKRFEVYRPRELAIAKGDRIRITRNGEAKIDGQAKGTRINNGDIFTVEGFDKQGNIRLEKGKMLPKDYGHFALGYVDTSYASQGKTVDRVFIATGSESLRAVGQQQWYVSTSRGREMAKIYVEDKREVRDAIARTGERLSAVELTHTKIKRSWRSRVHESWERNRVRSFLRARADAVGNYWRERSQGIEAHV
jgi:ATP-dependent exoDNAse (exonuclease V) alpha subunit